MLTSRISRCFKSASNQQPLTYFFGFIKKSKYMPLQSSQTKLTPLKTQIVSARTINDYYKIYEQNKADFNQDIIMFSMHKIWKLVSNNVGKIDYKKMQALVKEIQKINVQTLTINNITTLFAIFRQIKNHGFSRKMYFPFMAKLQDKFISLIKKTDIDSENIQEIIYSYFEFSVISQYQCCKIISSKLIDYIETKRNNRQILNKRLIVLLMKCLATKNQLNNDEITIRSYLLEQIKENLYQMSIINLIQLCNSILNMDFFDLQQKESEALKDISNFIIKQIPTLKQDFILQLVQNKFVCKYPGFMRIYIKILNHIFLQIDTNGYTQLNADIVLKIFSSLSKKLSLEETQEHNQQKFFAFLTRQINNKYIHYILTYLVNNNFFNKKQMTHLQNIFKTHKVQPNLKLMYLMSINDTDMSQFEEHLTQFIIKDKNRNNILMAIIILNKLKNNTTVANKLTQLLTNITPNFETPQSFIKFYSLLREDRDQVNLYHLNEVLHKNFASLPNPFQKKINIQQYRFFYLDYVYHSFSSKDFLSFLQTYNVNIQLSEIIKLISVYVRGEVKYLQSEKSLIFILNSKISQIMYIKNKQYIKLALLFLTKYNRFAVYQILQWQQETQLFQIISKIFEKAFVLVQTELIFSFSNMIDKYITRNHRNYNLEFNYRHLLDLVIRNISLFDANWHLIKSTIEHSIRLNMLTAKHIENINLQKILFSSQLIKMKAFYIKDPSFYNPSTILTTDTLTVILSNQNYAKYIAQHKDDILETIQNSSIQTIFTCAVHYNQPDSPVSTRIIGEIFRIIREKIIMFQNYDIIGLFRNAFLRNLFFLDQCKQITQNIVRFMTSRPVAMASLHTHLEVIKFIITQPAIETNEYYSNLVQFYSHTGNKSFVLNMLHHMLSHTDYPFKSQELKIVQQMMKRGNDPFYAVFFFLMLQHKMQPQYRSQIATKLSILISQAFQNYSRLKKQKQLLSNPDKAIFGHFDRLKCQYLKSAYPQQTKPLLSIPQHELWQWRISYKCSVLLRLLKQIANITKNTLVSVTQFGQKSCIVKIKDYVFVFISTRRVGAYYQHEFIKRAIIQLIDEPVHVICLNSRKSTASNLQSIVKNFPGLMSAQQIALIKIWITKTNKEDSIHRDIQ